MPQSWFAFKNSSDNKSVEISIYDLIGSYAVSAKSFIAELKRAAGKDIDLRIHSPGGNVLEGNAIYNALLRHNGAINVHIDGIAASMASVVAMAGDTIEIAENGMMMVHNPTASAFGEAKDLRKMADVADKLKAGIVAAYQKKTGLGAEKISQLMDEETWFTAAEALKDKFVDFIGDKVDVKNSFDLSAFKNAPRIDTTAAEQAQASLSMATETPEAKIKRLEAEAVNFATERTELTDKNAKIEGELKIANDKVIKLEGEGKVSAEKILKIEGELKIANDKVTKLEGESKSAEERAREVAAASGVQASAKAADVVNAAAAADGKELYDKYEKLMNAGKSKEAAEFYAQHEKAIEAYGQSTLNKD